MITVFCISFHSFYCVGRKFLSLRDSDEVKFNFWDEENLSRFEVARSIGKDLVRNENEDHVHKMVIKDLQHIL